MTTFVTKSRKDLHCQKRFMMIQCSLISLTLVVSLVLAFTEYGVVAKKHGKAKGKAPQGIPLDASNCVYNATKNKGMIQSLPGTGADYPNNLECQYIFHVPDNRALNLYFDPFELERGIGCAYDYIQINGGHNLCGNTINNECVKTPNEVVLLFLSDASISGRGFVAQYDIKEGDLTGVTCTHRPPTAIPATSVSECNFTSTDLEGSYSLITNSGAYPHNMRCEIILKSPEQRHVTTITFTYFAVQYSRYCNDHDYLQVMNGDRQEDILCGYYEAPFTKQYDTDEPVLTMTFVSDDSVTAEGFGFNYTTELVPECNFHSTDLNGSYSLPTISEGYANNLQCVITLESVPSSHVIEINFLNFDVEDDASCGYDYLEVKTGNVIVDTLCGHHEPFNKQYKTDEAVLTLTFVSDGAITADGFAFNYTTVIDNI